MSTLKVGSIRGVSASSDAITVSNDGSCTANITNNLSNRNLVINGAMEVAQRGTSFTNVGAQEYTLDRFVTLHSYGGTQMGVSQSSTSPDGFSNSYKLDVNTADTSIGAAEFVFIRHKLEAQNLQQLAYGTSGAKSITLSFYVRSNVTGTYAICLQQKDNSSKQVNGSYTINSADTWERKTFTYAGDTSGVINNDSGHGLDILWTLAAGSDRTSGSVRSTWTAHANADESVGQTANILHSTSNNFHLTGVQLEVGSVATDFEHRSFGDELLKCQRYFYKTYDYDTAIGTATTVGAFVRSISTQQTYAAMSSVRYPVSMRDNPTVTAYSTQNANTTGVMSADASDKTIAIHYIGHNGHFPFINNSSSGVTVNVFLRHQFTADSEL